MSRVEIKKNRLISDWRLAGAVVFLLLAWGCGGRETSGQEGGLGAYGRTAETYPRISGTDLGRNGRAEVKNVILCIGDGMGVGQVAITRLRTVGADGRLYIERMPVAGIMRTHSADSLVTDSAAAATAMACGVKTKKGTVGMDAEGRRRENILEAAKAKGMRTGIVVTSSITNATPACFASHVSSRKMEEQIAEQLLDNRVNVMFGGGWKFFLPFITGGGVRTDGRDLIKEAKEGGYYYLDTADKLESAEGEYVLGLFAAGSLTTREPEPSLGELTEKAIKFLSKEEGEGEQGSGFFLMVEGSKIDRACHENNEEECVRQVLLFDEAVKAGIDFAMSKGRTLVVVTADHETGGLVITGEEGGSSKPEVKWSSKGHTAMPVAVYAFGPGAEEFSGVYDNTEIAKKTARLLGIDDFAIVKQAWESKDREAEIFSRLYLTGVSK